MQRATQRRALRFILKGGVWGEDGQHRAGPGLLGLKDYAPGKEHLPHPMILKLTGWMPPKQFHHSGGSWSGGGKWIPRSLEHHAETLQPSDPMYKWLGSSHRIYYCDGGTILDGHMRFPSGPVQVQRCPALIENQGRRKLIFREGDDVQVMWGAKAAYCTIQQVLVVWILPKAYIWLVPGVWYYEIEKGKAHHLRSTSMQRREVPGTDRSFAPIPAHDIIQQVAVQHSCEMTGPRKCSFERSCQHGAACRKVKCARWVHFKESNRFEIIDRAAGFVSSYIYQ